MKPDSRLGQVIAEMWMLGSWKMRFRLLRKLRKEEGVSLKQLAGMILIACFTDICEICYGREWVVKVVRNKDYD